MQKKLFSILSLLFFFIVSSIGQTSEEDLVKQIFENYKSAILNDEGESELNYIDSRTLKYYTDILDAVKNADSTRVDTFSLIDKITVFSIRHRATKEEIIGMNGNGLFAYAIKNGMVGKNSVVNNSIGEVLIDETFAKGQLLVKGKKAPLYFNFYKRNGSMEIRFNFFISCF